MRDIVAGACTASDVAAFQDNTGDADIPGVRPFRLFAVAGIPVQMRPEFLLVVAVLGLGSEGLDLVWWIAVVTVSIVVHEFGHAFAFRAFGWGARIELVGFGGLTHGEPDGDPLPTWAHVCVSLAGSVAGFLFVGAPALAVLATGDPGPAVTARLEVVVWVAVVWGALNLLPMMPLDGGNATAAILEHRWGPRGTIGARVISIAVAVALGALAWQRGYPFALVMCAWIVAVNVGSIQRTRDEDLASDLRDAARLLRAGDLEQARPAAAAVREHARSAAVRGRATVLEAWISLGQGDAEHAASLVARLPRDEDHGLLRAVLAVDRGSAAAVEDLVRALRDPGRSPPADMLAIAIDDRGIVEAVADRLVVHDDDASARALGTLALGLHRTGRYAASAGVSARLATLGAALDARASAAYNVACSLARAGRLEGAEAWLADAVGWGFRDAEVIERDEDLDVLRTRPAYLATMARLRNDPLPAPPPAAPG